MRALREVLHPQRALWRKLLLGLAAVATIVAGLLAMHSLNLPSHHNEVVVAQPGVAVVAQPGTVDEPHHTASAIASLAADDTGTCDGACGMNSMLGACIFALLAAGALLAGAATLSRTSAIHLVLARSIAAVTSVAPPTPPSLHALSISRT